MNHDNELAPTLPTSNELALARTRMASDRTMMAWIRTATSLISFGFTIYKFFEYVHAVGQPAPVQHRIGPRQFAMLMILTGVIMLAVATFDHYRTMHNYRSLLGKQVYSIATVPAVLVSVLGLIALIAVWFRF